MFQRIVVPLDGGRFAEAALAPARELARAFSSRLLLVRAVPPHGFPVVTPGSRTDVAAAAGLAHDANPDEHQIVVERADEADAYLHTVTQQLRLAGYDADMTLALAAPGSAIAQAAAIEHADLIMMATHLRWKVPAAFAASPTLDVLVRSRVPLLAWRVTGAEEPEGGPDVDDRPPLLARPAFPLLVPLDGTPLAEHALLAAEALARTFGLRVVLVCAVSEPQLEADAAAYLRDIQAELKQRGVPALPVTGVGDPLRVIETIWRREYGGLIVMASRGRRGPHGTIFGSLAARVLEEAEASVLVVRPPEGNAATAGSRADTIGTMNGPGM